MSESEPEPGQSASSHDREYQDPHFHDDDEAEVRIDDVGFGTPRKPPARKKMSRPPPSRRRYVDD